MSLGRRLLNAQTNARKQTEDILMEMRTKGSSQSKPIRPQLGNSIRLRADVDDKQDTFLIDSIGKFINCVSVMAKHVKARTRFTVKIELVKGEDNG